MPLLGITYFGFDPSTIKERKKIQIIKRNLLAFKSFYILMPICFVFLVCLGIFVFNYIEYEGIEFNPFYNILFILLLFQTIMNLISLILPINNIHDFIFKIIYKDEKKDNYYKVKICFYIINILAFSSVSFQFLYFIIKNCCHFKDFLKIIINRKKPSKNNDKSNGKSKDNINSEKKRLNINEYINLNSNNKNNKTKQKEKMKSLQILIKNNKNEINKDKNKQKEEMKSSHLLIINKKIRLVMI